MLHFSSLWQATLTRRIAPLIIGAMALVALPLSPVPGAVPALAGSAAYHDPCSASLPPQLAFTGGPYVTTYTLHGGGATLMLTQYGRGGLAGEMRLLGLKPLANDTVAEFTFILPRQAHIYGGPLHVFRHGLQQHACRRGAVAVDAHGNSTQQVNPYLVRLSLNGTITGATATATVRVGGVRYHLSGSRIVVEPNPVEAVRSAVIGEYDPRYSTFTCSTQLPAHRIAAWSACPFTSRFRRRLLQIGHANKGVELCGNQFPPRTVRLRVLANTVASTLINAWWDFGPHISYTSTFVVIHRNATWLVDNEYLAGKPLASVYTEGAMSPCH